MQKNNNFASIYVFPTCEIKWGINMGQLGGLLYIYQQSTQVMVIDYSQDFDQNFMTVAIGYGYFSYKTTTKERNDFLADKTHQSTWRLTVYLWWITSYKSPYGVSIYRKIANIRRTKIQNVNDYRLVLQLSLPNPLNPGLKSRMKMQLEQRRQAMLQLHLSHQQF